MRNVKRPLEDWQLQDAERLKQLFKERATLSQEEFGAKYGIGSQGMVWQYLNGRTPLNLKAAINFATGLNVPVSAFSPKLATEIFQGVGAPVDEQRSATGQPAGAEKEPGHWDGVDRRSAPHTDRRQTPEIPEEAAVRAYESIDELNPETYVLIDRYDVRLSAGSGNLQWVVHGKDPIAFRAGWFQQRRIKAKDCRGLYVRGRSMEPKLEDWDTVVIDTSQTDIIDGEIYAVQLDGEFFIKTVERIPGGIRLKSENPEFMSFDVTGEQLELVRIIGKKIWRGG